MKLRKTEVQKDRPVIYVGPSFLGLPTNTIFREGANKYPEHVARMIEKNPAIGQLMVPVADVQQARANVRTQGHILNTLYKQAVKGA
nr:MAG TPA: hypothetical protein [Caudoviricetes sp.]